MHAGSLQARDALDCTSGGGGTLGLREGPGPDPYSGPRGGGGGCSGGPRSRREGLEERPPLHVRCGATGAKGQAGHPPPNTQ